MSADPILVAIDFSACSAAAFREAKRLAAWHGAPLAVLHVVTPFPPLMPALMWPAGVAIPPPTDDDLIGRARRRWGAFAEECGGANGAQFSVEIGVPRDRILDAVRRERPRMLLVGAFATEDAHRGIGATAAACAQRAATQVMVVRDGSAGPFRSVVACIDFSDTSRLALEQAISIAAEDGAALHILHVLSDPWRGAGPPDDIKRHMPEFSQAYRSAVEGHMREFCAPFVHELSVLKPTIHAIEAPSHAQGIKTFIVAHRCDLAVLGTRGEFNLRDLFWGSTAEHVVREALCSVLAVKPPGFVEAPADEPQAGSAEVLHEVR